MLAVCHSPCCPLISAWEEQKLCQTSPGFITLTHWGRLIRTQKKKKPMTGQISRPGSDFCEWMSGTIQRFSSEGPKLNFAPLRDWVSFPYIIQAPPVLFNFILKLYIHFKLGCPVHIHYEKYFHYLPSCLFQSDYFYSFFPILPFCWAQDPA